MRYRPPELVGDVDESDSRVTYASDVFSFGLVIQEVSLYAFFGCVIIEPSFCVPASHWKATLHKNYDYNTQTV